MTATPFVLHPRLVTATRPVGDLPLCRVLLIDDRRYPWLLLVPRRPGIEEIADLTPADRAVLIEEIAAASNVLRSLYDPFRLNIADIGNRAEQLHIHIVARAPDDEAWPKVVWSRDRAPYEDLAARDARLDQLRAAFADRSDGFHDQREHTDPGVAHL